MVSNQVGRSIDRVEGRDKVTGKAHYTADVRMAGLTYAVLVQSEVPHGTVTPESPRQRSAGSGRAGRPPRAHTAQLPCAARAPHDLTYDLPIERRPPLSDLTVQHVGQHMAMVVAETWEAATYAASLFDLEYHRSAPQLTARQVLDEPVAVDEQGGRIRHGSYLPDHFVKLVEEKLQDRRGEPAETSANRVAAHYRTPINAHYPIELSSTIAAWDDDQLTVHDTTRWITGERRCLAAYLGISEAKVRILAPLVGGAFGSRAFCGCTWC